MLNPNKRFIDIHYRYKHYKIGRKGAVSSSYKGHFMSKSLGYTQTNMEFSKSGISLKEKLTIIGDCYVSY